jgi:hypothetical protein
MCNSYVKLPEGTCSIWVWLEDWDDQIEPLKKVVIECESGPKKKHLDVNNLEDS